MAELTPNDIIDAFEMSDEVEITAVVRRVDAVKVVGKLKKFSLFKFILDNMTGRQVQSCAWSETANPTSQVATLNTILHLEGARTKLIEPNQKQYNGGNVNFELNINAGTVLENLGIWSDEATENQRVYVPTTWEDVSYSSDQYVAVDAWIKNAFRNLQIDGHAGASGYITDGRRKLLVRVSNDPELINQIERGLPVLVQGQMLPEPSVPNRLYLRVPSGARVSRREGQPMAPEQLIRVTANVQREIRPVAPVVEAIVMPVVVPIPQPVVEPEDSDDDL